MTRLQQLSDLGQAPWLDFLRRRWIAEELPAQIRAGVCGVTSNPSIFEKAIGESSEYDDDLRARLLGSERSSPVMALYEALAIRDIRAAAEVLRPLYEATRGADGFVSLEVSPYLANDTEATINEARRLWKTVACPNVMIKVPGTAAAIPAIDTLIGEGINVNVTLLFSVAAYEQVALAYLSGLEAWRRSGGNLARVASVASFFVSRIDSAVDKKLDALPHGSVQAELVDRLRGKIAVANAKRAYQRFRSLYAQPHWQELARSGARPQRLLWASTGVKNPRYPDTLYVDELIGRETVNTMPPATLKAFADHGRLRADAIETGVSEAEQQLADLGRIGVSLDEITDALVADGLRLFADAFDQLLAALANKRQRFLDLDA